MSAEVCDAPPQLSRLDSAGIQSKVAGCPRLPSLRSIESALHELLNADQRYTHQIAEVIRRDPSLTARLLRLVNSVYDGLPSPINNPEEAVLYLGLRQIRQLVMVTPIVEDFQRLTAGVSYNWREFWQHCIGTAILTREVMGSRETTGDESDYVAGLTHDLGKLVMAWAFPEHFQALHQTPAQSEEELLAAEESILGINHDELGGVYLRHFRLPEVLVEAARHHHHPERATHHRRIVAAVQIADLLMRQPHLSESDGVGEITDEIWINASGWSILFPQGRQERAIAQASLKRSLERLPALLHGLV